MSGFGGGSNFGGGGRGGSSGGRGRSSGRGRGRGPGRGGQQGRHTGGPQNRTNYPQPLLKPCKNFTLNGNCTNNHCKFAHVVKVLGTINASSPIQNTDNNNNYNNNRRQQEFAAVTSVAVWETAGVVKLFTGSQDGFWRLWNFTGNTFVKEFENNMGGPVECLTVASNHLFVGFEGVSPSLPEINVGMVHAWNLANPADPPAEFHTQALIPYAHPKAVTVLLVEGEKVVSGSKDGSIKVWGYDVALNNGNGGFALTTTLAGHARDVTGLAVADAVLWSCSTDGSIRIWDMAGGGNCQFAISMSHAGATPFNPQQQAQSPGHTNAVTSLVSFQTQSGIFIISSSLDGDIKAWNGTTGQCVASESHGEGVISMSMATDSGGKPFLLLGLEGGNILARNLEPTPKIPNAFACVFTLVQHLSAGHMGAVKTVSLGPAGTFYSGGVDGKVLVFQTVGDLGL